MMYLIVYFMEDEEENFFASRNKSQTPRGI